MKVEIRFVVSAAAGGVSSLVLELDMPDDDDKIARSTTVTRRVNGKPVSPDVFRDVIALCSVGRLQ